MHDDGNRIFMREEKAQAAHAHIYTFTLSNVISCVSWVYIQNTLVFGLGMTIITSKVAKKAILSRNAAAATTATTILPLKATAKIYLYLKLYTHTYNSQL